MDTFKPNTGKDAFVGELGQALTNENKVNYMKAVKGFIIIWILMFVFFVILIIIAYITGVFAETIAKQDTPLTADQQTRGRQLGNGLIAFTTLTTVVIVAGMIYFAVIGKSIDKHVRGKQESVRVSSQA